MVLQDTDVDKVALIGQALANMDVKVDAINVEAPSLDSTTATIEVRWD